MKRFYFLLIILVSSFTYTFCQSNWKRGYILETNNDSLKGFIDDRGSKSNAQFCYFRVSLNSETIRYSPENTHGYRFENGKFYISRKINDDNLEKTVFLEFLIKGEVNIYHINVGVDRYFIEKDTLFYELKNTTKIITVAHKKEGRANGKDYETQYEKESNEYKGMLNYLMQDANISQEIQKSTLSNKSLIKVAKNYNEAVCPDEGCIIFEKPEEKFKINFRLHAGLSMNYFNFGDQMKSEYSTGTLIGCRFVITHSIDWMERIDFHVDLTLQNFSDYRLSLEEGNEAVRYRDEQYRIGPDDLYNSVPYLDVNINALALKMPVSVNYNFLNKKFKPYVGVGLNNVFILSQNKSFIYHKYYKEYGRSIPPIQVGYIGKIGGSYEIKNISVYFDLNYEYSSNLGKNEYLFKNQLFSFNLGIAI